MLFNLQAVGYQSASPPQRRLSEPPIELSEQISATDGVVQVVIVPVISEEDHGLNAHVFIDSEWNTLVAGEARLSRRVFVIGPGYVPDGPTDEIEISERHTFYQKVSLPQPSEFEDCTFVGNIMLTNITGEPSEILEAAVHLELNPGEVVVYLEPV